MYVAVHCPHSLESIKSLDLLPLNWLQGKHRKAMRMVAKWLALESMDKAKADKPLVASCWTYATGDNPPAPRQTDGVSCGIFTIM